jgi:predicted DNA-binding transcriptional regulator YafY
MSTDELNQAVEQSERVIAFTYTDRDENITRRVVSPYEARTTKSGKVMIVGYDHTREAIRHFAVEQLTELEECEHLPYREPAA